jgi:hypothetical protein
MQQPNAEGPESVDQDQLHQELGSGVEASGKEVLLGVLLASSKTIKEIDDEWFLITVAGHPYLIHACKKRLWRLVIEFQESITANPDLAHSDLTEELTQSYSVFSPRERPDHCNRCKRKIPSKVKTMYKLEVLSKTK